MLLVTDAMSRAENGLKQPALGGKVSDVWNQPIVPTDAPDLCTVSFALTEPLPRHLPTDRIATWNKTGINKFNGASEAIRILFENQ